MSAYHQMGHHSENLLNEPELCHFRGAILSPVNYTLSNVITQVETLRARPVENGERFEIIFDPQLYFPETNRERLREWDYFPNDVDTADITSNIWWGNIINNLILECAQFSPDFICSPSIVPRVFSNEYYSQMVNVGNLTTSALIQSGTRPIQTVVADLGDLAARGRSLEVASIVSSTNAEGIYLILRGDTDPRRELSNPEELKGAMRLIAELEASGLEVLVGFCSSDMALWKVAGATSCATGKFFNLRRFTRSRFEEPSGGGGQLPYWFEESLFAFLRESDVLRVRTSNLLRVSNKKSA